MPLEKPYTGIPGTTIFDADQSRKGYHLNTFCMSLMKASNRERFKSNERAYLDEWPMSENQRQAVLARDYNRMIELGGNIYFLAKIFATDGKSFQYAAALMTGMTQEAYAQMMLSGGRPPAREEKKNGLDLCGRRDIARAGDRRGSRSWKITGAVLGRSVQRLRLLQTLDCRAEARRHFFGVQRSRDGV